MTLGPFFMLPPDENKPMYLPDCKPIGPLQSCRFYGQNTFIESKQKKPLVGGFFSGQPSLKRQVVAFLIKGSVE